MGNSATRSINYTPRYTDQEAYDLCPPQVRKALDEAVTSWSASSALRFCKKHGWLKTVAWLQKGDADFIAKKNWDRGPCPSAIAKVKPLRANW